MAVNTKTIAASSRLFSMSDRTRDAIKVQDAEGNRAAIVRSDADHVEELAEEVIEALAGPEPVMPGLAVLLKIPGRVVFSQWSAEVYDAKGRGSVTVLKRGRRINDNEWVIMPLEANVKRVAAAIGVANEGRDGQAQLQQAGQGREPVQRRRKVRKKPGQRRQSKGREDKPQGQQP